ncbi:MAG TPA: hypothetical protein VJI67_03555 [archaeon]|nr:hypothetical protein [archaeon]HLD80981.1 hypothetical protein [archaeon]
MNISSEALKNWKVRLLVFFVLISLVLLGFKGLKYGIDFTGGTLFQIHLAQKATPQQLSEMSSVIASRVDAYGLRGASVIPSGDQFVLATIAETNPEFINNMQELLSKQGKLENVINKKVVFTGADIISIGDSSANAGSFGVFKSGNGYEWSLPFTLTVDAAKRFTHASYNQCTPTGCVDTYFFIDRPTNAILVFPSPVFENDAFFLESEQSSPQELLEQSGLEYFVVDGNALDGNQSALVDAASASKTLALVHPGTQLGLREILSGKGFKVQEVKAAEKISEGVKLESWLWAATRTRAVISLTPSVANIGIPEDQLDKRLQQELRITGGTSTPKEANARLQELRVLLKSGSLPIPVDDISKNTISPSLGKSFQQNSLLAGVLSMLAVGLIVFLRYKTPMLAFPVILTSFSEVVLILGFASLIGWSIDLAGMAGIIAAVGTGVDNQIVIMDELLRKKKDEDGPVEKSPVQRVKNAFFIIVASSSIAVATMLPIILFGLGQGQLVGFAITTISGVMVGVLVSRPAFAEIARMVVTKLESSQ